MVGISPAFWTVVRSVRWAAPPLMPYFSHTGPKASVKARNRPSDREIGGQRASNAPLPPRMGVTYNFQPIAEYRAGGPRRLRRTGWLVAAPSVR